MKTRLLLIALLLVQSAWAQPKNSPRFDRQAFAEKIAVAEWMSEYDSIAWRMSELVTMATYDQLERIDRREWFCFKGKDSLWNAVYGKYNDSTYDLVLHYKLMENDTIDAVCDAPDTAMLHSVSRAINIAYREAAPILGKTSTRFNKFVRYHTDKTVSVWLLPALQSLGIALYGGEFYYHFDPSGTQILEKEEYYQGSFKGFKTGKPRDVRLNYEDAAAPTQGAVYFAVQYRKFFTNIHIDTRESTSVQSFSPGKGYYWLHADKLRMN